MPLTSIVCIKDILPSSLLYLPINAVKPCMTINPVANNNSKMIPAALLVFWHCHLNLSLGRTSHSDT